MGNGVIVPPYVQLDAPPERVVVPSSSYHVKVTVFPVHCAVHVVFAAGIVNVPSADTFPTLLPQDQPLNVYPFDAVHALDVNAVTVVPSAYGLFESVGVPVPFEPHEYVKVYKGAHCAVHVVFAAGIVNVPSDDTLPTLLSQDQPLNVYPLDAVHALDVNAVTVVPSAYGLFESVGVPVPFEPHEYVTENAAPIHETLPPHALVYSWAYSEPDEQDEAIPVPVKVSANTFVAALFAINPANNVGGIYPVKLLQP